MANVFDEIYEDAFKSELVKIAQENKIDPDQFVKHVMEKRANMKGAATAALNFAKKQGTTIQGSFKNALEAGKGLVQAAKAPNKPAMHEGLAKFKENIKKSKAAAGIVGGGTLAAGYGASKV